MEVKRRAFLQLLAATPLAALVPWQPPPRQRRMRIVRDGLPPPFCKMHEGRTWSSRTSYVREFSDDNGLTWQRYAVGCSLPFNAP